MRSTLTERVSKLVPLGGKEGKTALDLVLFSMILAERSRTLQGGTRWEIGAGLRSV